MLVSFFVHLSLLLCLVFGMFAGALACLDRCGWSWFLASSMAVWFCTALAVGSAESGCPETDDSTDPRHQDDEDEDDEDEED